jgi:ribosomal protein S18 acetylase RimI-like enzyme
MHATLDLAQRELRRAELPIAAQLLSRSMCDNLNNVRAFGMKDREGRQRSLARFFLPVLQGLHRRGLIVGAFCDGTLVGVCGIARPGNCQPNAAEKLAIVPALVVGNSVGTPLRILRWTGEWARRDPPAPHWHLGPVAVDTHLQGRGVGHAMLGAFCTRMDDSGASSYLETDKPENVGFYEKFGFIGVGESDVLGAANWYWYMSRPARVTGKKTLAEPSVGLSFRTRLQALDVATEFE